MPSRSTRQSTRQQRRRRTPSNRKRRPSNSAEKRKKTVVSKKTRQSARLRGHSPEYDGICYEDATYGITGGNRSIQKNVVIQDILERIERIPTKYRPTPTTKNLTVLGMELKMRLASQSSVIVETGRRGGKVDVTELRQKYRHVPVWDINTSQDPMLLCHVKVAISATRRKNK